MTALSTISASAIDPAMILLPRHMGTPAARLMLLAIGLQESRLVHRWQVLNSGAKGPARGLWQFERGSKASRGGVWGVYLHRASSELLRLLCRDRDVSFEPSAIWAQLEHDDVLAAGVARLLLWTDAQPLPAIGDEEAAWECYALRCWRPGALARQPEELRRKWAKNYAMAMDEVQR